MHLTCSHGKATFGQSPYAQLALSQDSDVRKVRVCTYVPIPACSASGAVAAATGSTIGTSRSALHGIQHGWWESAAAVIDADTPTTRGKREPPAQRIARPG